MMTREEWYIISDELNDEYSKMSNAHKDDPFLSPSILTVQGVILSLAIVANKVANRVPEITPSCRNKEELENMLEDVVNELDLSDTTFEEHGPLGTAPSVLVRLVLDRKDTEIAMLKRGLVKIDALHNKD